MKQQKEDGSTDTWWQRTMPFLAVAILVGGLAGLVVGFVASREGADTSLAYATWMLAVFTLILAVGIPATISLSAEESKKSSRRSLEQEQDRLYAQLDGTYLEIQRLIIDYPYLGDPAALLKNPEAKPEQLRQYDAFAFIVWNFIESIHDFTLPGHRMTDMLSQSWECIVDYEGERHAQWFALDENQKKFKRSFCDHMADKLKRWTATPPPAPTT